MYPRFLPERGTAVINLKKKKVELRRFTEFSTINTCARKTSTIKENLRKAFVLACENTIFDFLCELNSCHSLSRAVASIKKCLPTRQTAEGGFGFPTCSNRGPIKLEKRSFSEIRLQKQTQHTKTDSGGLPLELMTSTVAQSFIDYRDKFQH